MAKRTWIPPGRYALMVLPWLGTWHPLFEVFPQLGYGSYRELLEWYEWLGMCRMHGAS